MTTLVKLWKSERGFCDCHETELIVPFDPALTVAPEPETLLARVRKAYRVWRKAR